MGQGIWSGLASIVAEELDASWAQVRVEGAPANQAVYKNLVFGLQTTGGSTSIANSWDQLRKAGATARAMLVQAAANQWQVNPQEIHIDDGVLRDATGARKLSFGELAEAAAKLEVPDNVALKNPADYKFLGKAWPRLDAKDKSTGKTMFGIDITDKQIPGLMVATVLRAPRFGATVKSFDASAALQVKGLVDVVLIPSGVAVIANRSWAAISARKLVKVEWDETTAEHRSTEQIIADFKKSAEGNGTDEVIVCDNHGDIDHAFATATQVLEAEFEFPYLAHAPMETLCAVGELTGPDGNQHCTIWGGIQNQTYAHKAAAKILGLPLENVVLNTLYAGGSFGRRATFTSDWISELAEILKATWGLYPIKVIRTRDDDIKGGYYRPMAYHKIKAGLDAQGNLLGLHQTIVAQSFLFPPSPPGVKGRPDPTTVDGSMATRYDIADVKLDWINPKTPVTVQMFRALSFNHTTTSKEIFIDELARATKRDPLEFRLAHLANKPRQAAVLKLAAEKAGWGNKRKPGHALGLAVQEAESTFIAQVAEVSIVDHAIRVERVVCVVDCGYALNPDNVKAQMEGGIGFGLGVALSGEISLKDGLVEQSNFHDYAVLRMNEMPKHIEVHILNSGHPPTGVGEPGSVVIAAAVANAVAMLTGKPIRKFPLSKLEL